MTPEQKAAYVEAQTCMMRAEAHIMYAENRDRDAKGLSPAHGPEQWKEFHNHWEAVLGHNALIKFFYD